MSWKRSVCVFVCVCVLTAGCSCSWEQGDPSGSVSIGQAHSPNDPGSSIANLEENYALITWTPESLAEEYGYQPASIICRATPCVNATAFSWTRFTGFPMNKAWMAITG